MAMQLNPDRLHLIEQVLEYWYTLDFLSQGGLDMEETRRDREGWAHAMHYPASFGQLFRHDELRESEDALVKVNQVENLIKERQMAPDEHGMPGKLSEKPPCHGKITVYLGEIDQAYLSGAIARELNCDPPLNPSSSKLALAALQLTDEGKYIRGTLSFSPIVWSLGRIMKRQDGDSMYDTLDPNVYNAAPVDYEPDKDEILTSFDSLRGLMTDIIEKTVVPVCPNREEAGLTERIYITYNIYSNADERLRRETDDYFGLSMSFYATDLAKFRNAAADGKWYTNKMWSALADYICAPYDMDRNVDKEHIDLGNEALKDPVKKETARRCLEKVLSVEYSPWGKWPSRRQPFFMQQVAINLAINTEEPIFAVNGPPGTGKTTLLREIVAENVVQRALIMSEYEKPDDMFAYSEMKLGNEKHYVYSFRADMKDIKKYGIVVASSNNNAVENISKQLPLVETLHKGLNGKALTPGMEEIQRMFTLEEAPLESAVRKQFDKEGQPREKVEFHDIYFSSYAKEMLRGEECWGLISAPLGKRSNVNRFFKKVLSQLKWDKYLQETPGGRMGNYQQARQDFIWQYQDVARLREILKVMTDRNYESGPEKYMVFEGRAELYSDELLDRLASDRPEIRKEAQMACVNASLEYDLAREKLFGCALKLIKEFILSSACCKSNLELLAYAWGVDNYKNPFSGLEAGEKEARLRECMTPLIQTLQLMVPVISTTFASAGRFFRHVIKPDALGMIIVDEAGQATPQMALSLFSKASRALVVGDPNQIDPVVTDELAFLETTLDDEIGSVYSERTISVQKIADYLSTYGSEQSDILGRYGKKWVGLPLYVHSRCVEPMFSISNRLSYGDTMLNITRDPGTEKQFCYGTSQWINIAGEAEDEKNHFVKAQGERVLELLETAFVSVALSGDEEKMKNGPDIFVISPFHTVADGMIHMITSSINEKHPVLLQNRQMVEDWLMDDQNPHIGTVHTFQGREADEVILLLGCDSDSTRSANWVNRNIVNVAVSRARYRLYAVGDARVWAGCSPIMEMKFDLDAHHFGLLEAAVGGAQASDSDEDLFDIPELPSSEMFDISDLTQEAGEEELLVDTDPAIENVRAAVPGLAGDFSAEQLGWFGLSSMEEFEDHFDEKTKDLLRTGMWIYAWIRPNANLLPEDYDASFVGICFCKAYEYDLRSRYFVWLQKLFPDDIVQGMKAGDITTEPIMIGDVTTFISNRVSDLSTVMKEFGHPECDVFWWLDLGKRFKACRVYRNKCAHPGEVFHWGELDELISQLFLGMDDHGKHVPGLVMDRTFPDTMAANFAEEKVDDVRDAMQAARDEQYAEELFRYCPVQYKMHVCPEDNSSLVMENFPVKNKDGKDKKLNMLHCRKCGRKFINVNALPASVHLEDYYLESVKSEDW